MPWPLAVSIRLYRLALARAPAVDFENSQFFLPMAKGRMAFSMAFAFICLAQWLAAVPEGLGRQVMTPAELRHRLATGFVLLNQ